MKERVFEDLHDLGGGCLEIELEFFLAGHGVAGSGAARVGVLLHPGKEVLILLKGLKGVEHICGLAEEAVDRGGGAARDISDVH